MTFYLESTLKSKLMECLRANNALPKDEDGVEFEPVQPQSWNCGHRFDVRYHSNKLVKKDAVTEIVVDEETEEETFVESSPTQYYSGYHCDIPFRLMNPDDFVITEGVTVRKFDRNGIQELSPKIEYKT